MILKDKTILIMGIRNKWSIAYGAAKAASEQGAKLCFTFMGEDNRDKIEELIENRYNTIILSNEVASFSESIIKKYSKNENINIIISANRE